MNFGVCDFSRFAVTDWRLCFLALMTATHNNDLNLSIDEVGLNPGLSSISQTG